MLFQLSWITAALSWKLPVGWHWKRISNFGNLDSKEKYLVALKLKKNCNTPYLLSWVLVIGETKIECESQMRPFVNFHLFLIKTKTCKLNSWFFYHLDFSIIYLLFLILHHHTPLSIDPRTRFYSPRKTKLRGILINILEQFQEEYRQKSLGESQAEFIVGLREELLPR